MVHHADPASHTWAAGVDAANAAEDSRDGCVVGCLLDSDCSLVGDVVVVAAAAVAAAEMVVVAADGGGGVCLHGEGAKRHDSALANPFLGPYRQSGSLIIVVVAAGEGNAHGAVPAGVGPSLSFAFVCWAGFADHAACHCAATPFSEYQLQH